MVPFSLPVRVHKPFGEDLPRLGCNCNGNFVWNPYKGVTGDPETDYGIKDAEAKQLQELNRAIDQATEAAIDAGCLVIQTAMGIKDGGFASVHFSNRKDASEIAFIFADYLLAEYSHSIGI
jgi:hypothetical protein